MTANDLKQILGWYNTHQRNLPWRKNRDPYRIWISEVMLQQTTTVAVLGYYEKFLEKFPTLESLANASVEDIYASWTGLGYYSRARNLFAAAQKIFELGRFPSTHAELIQLPGFGPYTARALSSIAFGEQVGVLDGNVIRIVSRKENINTEWWKPKERDHLQNIVDQFVRLDHSHKKSHHINQALMELGSLICTPKNPHCNQCPWMKSCKAKKLKLTESLPRRRSKKEHEIWVWSPCVINKNEKILIKKNNYAPFLKNSWILPGAVKKVSSRPQRYDFRHNVTHYNIYVKVVYRKNKTNKKVTKMLDYTMKEKKTDVKWVNMSEISRYAPTSLIKKVMQEIRVKK